MSPDPAPRQQPLNHLQRVFLSVETVLAYAWARRLTKSRPLPEALAVIRARSARVRRMPVISENPYRLSVAVQRVLRILPTDGRCLMQSVTLLTLLATRGSDATLVISTNPGGGFSAHAWLERDGQPLLPPERSEFRLVQL